GDQPLGLRADEGAGADAEGARAEAADGVPPRDQPPALAVRQVHLHRRYPALPVLPPDRHLPENRRHQGKEMKQWLSNTQRPCGSLPSTTTRRVPSSSCMM